MGHAFTDIEQLTPGCPYADWARPNIHWCEHNLCAYVAAPSNAWSNLFYLVFAYFMWRDARAMRSPTLAMFGNAAFCTGACSFVYHATYTLVGQFFDFVGMFIFVNLGITLNLRRFGYFPAWRTARLFYRSSVAVCSGAVVACYYARLPYQALIALLVAVALGQEVVLFARARRRAAAAEDRAARGKPRARAYWLYVSMCFMALGLTCSVLDGLRVWCDPDDHIVQGHSLWHMLTARSTVASISRCSSFFFRGGAPDLTLRRFCPLSDPLRPSRCTRSFVITASSGSTPGRGPWAISRRARRRCPWSCETKRFSSRDLSRVCSAFIF